jgi:peptide-methionine (S)-S-oxide reductase
VLLTRVGYMGGTKSSPSYHSMGDHTETTQIDFDPSKISYAKVLEHFFECHSPTAARSRQYMSVIFPHSDEQEADAKKAIEHEAKRRGQNIATKIIRTKRSDLTPAEHYHQKYMLRCNRTLMSALGITDNTKLLNSPLATRLNAYCAQNGSKGLYEMEKDAYDLNDQAKPIVEKLAARL